MRRTWSDVKQGDILHILVPLYVDKTIGKYEFQQTKVINIKETPENLGITVKFKYTNTDGYRKRCFMFISKNRYDIPVLAVNNYHFAMKPYKFGDILVSCCTDDELKNVYKNLIDNKQKEIEGYIQTQKDLLYQLEELKNNI